MNKWNDWIEIRRARGWLVVGQQHEIPPPWPPARVFSGILLCSSSSAAATSACLLWNAMDEFSSVIWQTKNFLTAGTAAAALSIYQSDGTVEHGTAFPRSISKCISFLSGNQQKSKGQRIFRSMICVPLITPLCCCCSTSTTARRRRSQIKEVPTKEREWCVR